MNEIRSSGEEESRPHSGYHAKIVEQPTTKKIELEKAQKAATSSDLNRDFDSYGSSEYKPPEEEHHHRGHFWRIP